MRSNALNFGSGAPNDGETLSTAMPKIDADLEALFTGAVPTLMTAIAADTQVRVAMAAYVATDPNLIAALAVNATLAEAMADYALADVELLNAVAVMVAANATILEAAADYAKTDTEVLVATAAYAAGDVGVRAAIAAYTAADAGMLTAISARITADAAVHEVIADYVKTDAEVLAAAALYASTDAGLLEAIRDLVAGFIVAGTGMTVTHSDAGNTLTLDAVSGAVVCFSAHKNAVDQTGIVTATATKITFTTEDYDVGAYYDAPNSRWTPPAGKIRISAHVYYTVGMVDQSATSLMLYKNGAVFKYMNMVQSSGVGNHGVNGSVMDNASGTDYYEIFFSAGGAGNKTVNGGIIATYFQGARLG